LGLLTADAVCAIDSSYGAPFDCASTVTQSTVKYSYADIYGCSVGDFKKSCYTTGATGSCCGCESWETDPSYIVPSSTTACKAVNTNWTKIALPTLGWLKEACPTAYVFPYDDASSTFTCQVLNGDNVNSTNFKIEFCPS
jgi:hypothetical protein